MNLIYDPISEDMIRGQTKVEINHNIDETYYSGNLEISNEVTLFKKFQNTYGTKPMYDMFKKGKDDYRLLELASGRGGGMYKQIENFKYILGIDISVNNIYSGKQVDSAYLRYLEELGRNRRNVKGSYGKKINKLPENKFLYIVGDMGKNFKKIQKESMIEEELKNIIKDDLINNTNNNKIDKKIQYKSANINNNYFIDVIFGKIPTKDLENDYRALIPYNNVINRNKFDVVSCQFAMHYMFKDEITLNNFIENISNNLKEGGYFIGSTMNGILVDKLLGNNNEVSGKVNDKIVWNIRKNYKKYDIKEPKNNYGLEIVNYFHSIGKEFTEYLVDFELFDSKMNSYGFRKLEKDDFKEFERHDKKYEDKEIENFYDFDKIYEYEKSKKNKEVNDEDLNKGSKQLPKNLDMFNIHEELFTYLSLYRRCIYKKIK